MNRRILVSGHPTCSFRKQLGIGSTIFVALLHCTQQAGFAAAKLPTVAWSPRHATLPELEELEQVAGPNPNLAIGVLPKFLTDAEIETLNAVAGHANSWEDRHEGLIFTHYVRRIESALREVDLDLYQKLLLTAWSVDQQIWKNLGPLDYTLPQIEYIEYDVEKLGCEGKIAKHNDNGSMVSLVALLSDPSEFQGGANFFKGAPQKRRVVLQTGDAVFFYGHQCEHWISPVTSGRRAILQIELQSPKLLQCQEDPEERPGKRKPKGSKGGRGRRR
ncbi:unnamed protein product [Symbiodinium necroappetens]|uniref:Prolyl 4-hydroxylase alpha subunit domain-containing protein n=1 Tax=Symbiodinium necroappetens TaxID=1628268 RepID=A0A813AGJ8_9DINO|nr:unnamed protein product [Symbiodinium necroappetens]